MARLKSPAELEELTEAILAGRFKPGETINVSGSEDSLIIRHTPVEVA